MRKSINLLHVNSGRYVFVCDPLKLTLQADNLYELIEDFMIVLGAIIKDIIKENKTYKKFLHRPL